VVDKNR
jgi:outer membrane protein assembly factor BamB